MTRPDGLPASTWFGPEPGAARLAVDQLLRETLEAGAKKAEVFAARTEARRLSDIDGAPPSRPAVSTIDYRVCVRVWDAEGQMGEALASGPHADEHDRGDLVARALASLAPARPGETEPAPRLDVRGRGLDICDRRLPFIDDNMRREVLESNLQACHAVDPRVRRVRFRYEELHETRAFASTAGLSVEEQGTRFALIGSASSATDAQPGRKVRGQLVSRNFAEVASRPLGHQLGTRLVATLQPAELPSTPTAVVFEQRAVAAMLPRILAAFSAERIGSGDSFLTGRVGTRVASSELHVVDDALRPGGMATRGFDERGVAPTSVNLLKEGRAAGLYQGPAAARMADARPSGHERSDGSIWPGNLVVRPGSRSRNMLFPDLGTFVIIDEIVDSASIDPASGTIDVGVLAFVADASGPHGCAGVHRLRCTVDELLGGVKKVCSDQERHGIVDTATWIVNGIWLS